jgi:hypothetical protein
MALRIKESKFPNMDEKYRVIFLGITIEMLEDDNVLSELKSLDLTVEDVDVVDDPS